MATYDGSLRFDTKIDSTGFDKGISLMKKAAGVLSFSALSKEIIDVGTAFEASMSQVAAVSLATGEELDALTAAAKEMGATTKYTAAEAADGLQFLSQAGYTAAESIEALPKVLRLAQAGGMDLAYASELLTDSMAVMGLGIKDMDNFSDQLAMAAAKSNASVAQLGEAVLIAGGQAKLAAMSTEEMNTALGILADNGIKGSEGGTALRNVLKNLYTPTSASAKVMKKLGLETADANGNLKDAQDVLKELKEKLDGMDESSRIKAMGDIFDTRTIAAANALLENSGERWDELEGYLSSCDGAAKTMAETMNDNLKGSLDEMSSAAEALGITIYEKASPAIKSIVELLTSKISSVDTFFAASDGLNLATLATNIGFASSAVLGYKAATSAATIAQALLNSTMSMSPIGLIGAGVATLAAVTFTAVTAVKNAEVEYYRMGEQLTDVGSKFESVNKKSAVTEEHINGWRELRASVDSNRLSADELAAAEKEIKAHEQWFIDNYGNYITAEEEKNGIRSETVDLLERESKALSEISALELESKLIEMSSDIPELQEKVAVLEAVNQKYEEEQKQILETETALQYLAAEWEKFSNTDDFNINSEETTEKLNEIATAAEKLGISIDMGGEPSILRLHEAIEKLSGQSEGLGNAIQNNAQKIEDGKKTLDTYADNVLKLIDFDADATYDEKIQGAEKFGVNYAEGIVRGIDTGNPAIMTRLDTLADDMLNKLYTKLDIHSPSRVTRDEIGKMMSLGVAYGIEDGAPVAISKMEELANSLIDSSLEGEERQEAIAKRMIDSLKNSLTLGVITEEQYYSQLAQLRDAYFKEGSEDWEKYSLDILKYSIDSAEEQKEALSDIYESILSDTQQKLEAVKAAQERMSESLSGMSNGFGTITYKGILENGEDVTDTVLNVSGLRAANDDKERFAAAAENARKRIANSLGSENAELAKKLYEQILSSDPEVGLAYAQAIVNAPENVFSDWIAEQLRGDRLNESVSKSLYSSQMEEVGAELSGQLYEEFDRELTEKFGELPENFWSFGEDAAEGFYEGFMADLEGYMSDIIANIETRISDVTGSYVFGSSGGGGNTYSSSYVVQVQGGTSVNGELAAIHNAETLNKMRGGY